MVNYGLTNYGYIMLYIYMVCGLTNELVYGLLMGYGIFTYIGIILNYFRGQWIGKYSSTMDPLGMVYYG